MFGSRYRDKNQRNNSFTKTLVNIATIISTAITCIRLAYNQTISIQTAALIMFGVVVFVALGNNLAKIVLTAVALFLFISVYSHGDKAEFLQLSKQTLTLIIVLIGLYLMIRSFFKR